MIASFVFFASSLAHASAVDFTQIPEAFCKPAAEVSANTVSCQDNGTFLRASNDCLAKLEQLETQLGAEGMAIAKSGTGGQQSENKTGHSEYDFTASSLAYLIAVAGLARGEHSEYQTLVAPPGIEYDPFEEDSQKDPEGWFRRVPCFGETQTGLEKNEAALDAKIQRYTARRAEALSMKAKLAVHGTNYGSLSAPTATGRDTRSAPPKGLPAKNNSDSTSDITGVQQDKQKQNQ